MRRSAARSRRGRSTTLRATIHCFVARRFESEKGNPEPVPTSDAIAAFELQPLRDAMIRAGLTVVPRMEGDQPHIVEVWL